MIDTHQAAYDPRVATRVLRGAGMTAFDYIDLLAARADWIARMEAQLAGFVAVLSPTVPMVAPPIADLLNDDTEFLRVNGLLLRNTAVVNMLESVASHCPAICQTSYRPA